MVPVKTATIPTEWREILIVMGVSPITAVPIAPMVTPRSHEFQTRAACLHAALHTILGEGARVPTCFGAFFWNYFPFPQTSSRFTLMQVTVANSGTDETFSGNSECRRIPCKYAIFLWIKRIMAMLNKHLLSCTVT